MVSCQFTIGTDGKIVGTWSDVVHGTEEDGVPPGQPTGAFKLLPYTPTSVPRSGNASVVTTPPARHGGSSADASKKGKRSAGGRHGEASEDW